MKLEGSPVSLSQAFLNRPSKLFPHGQLVPILNEFTKPSILHLKQCTSRPLGFPTVWRNFAVRLPRMMTVRRVAQADPVSLQIVRRIDACGACVGTGTFTGLVIPPLRSLHSDICYQAEPILNELKLKPVVIQRARERLAGCKP